MNRININGEWVDTASTTLDDLLVRLGYDSQTVATAIDGAFVAREQRAAVEIGDGAHVEIVAPMQGG